MFLRSRDVDGAIRIGRSPAKQTYDVVINANTLKGLAWLRLVTASFRDRPAARVSPFLGRISFIDICRAR